MVLFMHVDYARKGALQIIKTTSNFTCELLSFYRASDQEGCACNNAILNIYF